MKKIALVVVVIIIVFGLFMWINKTIAVKKDNLQTPTQQPTINTHQQNEPPKIISTKPEPLEEAVIPATEIVEITFNRPLENVGEFKVRIEPKIDYKAKLSSDRKTAKILPAKPYNLGTTYTLFIGPETKFDGVGRWGEEKIFHFRTIKYTGA